MVQFKLNMPASLRERLGAAAAKSGRSLTAEAIARLEKALEADAEWDNAIENINDALSRIEALEQQMRNVMYHTGLQE